MKRTIVIVLVLGALLLMAAPVLAQGGEDITPPPLPDDLSGFLDDGFAAIMVWLASSGLAYFQMMINNFASKSGFEIGSRTNMLLALVLIVAAAVAVLLLNMFTNGETLAQLDPLYQVVLILVSFFSNQRTYQQTIRPIQQERRTAATQILPSTPQWQAAKIRVKYETIVVDTPNLETGKRITQLQPGEYDVLYAVNKHEVAGGLAWAYVSGDLWAGWIPTARLNEGEVDVEFIVTGSDASG